MADRDHYGADSPQDVRLTQMCLRGRKGWFDGDRGKVHDRSWSLRTVSIVIALIVALLAGCSSDDPTVREALSQQGQVVTSPDRSGQTVLSDRLKDKFESERGWMNEFEVAVLEDGIITDLELNEAVSMFHSCLADRGATGVLKVDYTGVGAHLTIESVDAFAAKYGTEEGGNQANLALDTCLTLGIRTIGVYYSAQIGNPDGRGLQGLVIQCASTVGHPGIFNGLTENEIFELEGQPAQWNQLPTEVQECIIDPFTPRNTHDND